MELKQYHIPVTEREIPIYATYLDTLLLTYLPKEKEREWLSKRHLIGNVVKASDGSFQLFADLKSHIGTNKIGCCGRSFVTDNRKKEPVLPIKKSNALQPDSKNNCSAKWKSVVQKVKQEVVPFVRKSGIFEKTYSTYALDFKVGTLRFLILLQLSYLFSEKKSYLHSIFI